MGAQAPRLKCASSASRSLSAKLLAAGFLEVHLLTDNLPRIGILFDQDVSQPLIARRQPFVMDKCATSQIIDEWRTLGHQASHEREMRKRW